MTTTTGTITMAYCRVSYIGGRFLVNYYIRVNGADGRPEITINNFPSAVPAITQIGNPTHIRIGDNTTNEISDNSRFEHGSESSTAAVKMYSFIGRATSGTGYMVLSGTVGR